MTKEGFLGLVMISIVIIILMFGLSWALPQNKVEVTPNYNNGTPAYDLMTITNSQTMPLGNRQKAVLVGVDVMNLWLQNATNKEIVSITAFNRGLQGSTSSFLIVYWELKT